MDCQDPKVTEAWRVCLALSDFLDSAYQDVLDLMESEDRLVSWASQGSVV